MDETGTDCRTSGGGRRGVVSIKEVAEIAGVSIATVSRCLNSPDKVTERTRLKVQSAIDETGYSPNPLAQNFRRGRTNLVLVVVPSVGDPFFDAIMHGIQSVASAEGYSVIIEETSMQSPTVGADGTDVVAKQADGVILLCNAAASEPGILRSASRRSLPVIVGFEATSEQLSGYASVHIDNAAAASDATRHLIDLGHERIAMLSGTEQLGLTIDRESGYRAAMSSAGLGVADGWVIDGGLSIDGARSATRRLLQHRQRPSAIFCAADEMAFGCLHEIKQHGLSVPEDISIVGFDDMRYAAIADPPLTTVSQPTKQIGQRAMQMVLHEINGGTSSTPRSEVLPYQLVIRASSGPVRDR